MTKKEFFREVTKGKRDLLAEFVGLLKRKKIPFCVIGGLAVNAYAEPVVSLDLDVVTVAKYNSELMALLEKKYKVERHPNSIDISSPDSDLRIQLQTDIRYQDFIAHAKEKEVLGISSLSWL